MGLDFFCRVVFRIYFGVNENELKFSNVYLKDVIFLNKK
jgi:hypothetical protein